MKFIRVDKYAQKSDDDLYSVCAIGSAGGWVSYSAWRTREHPGGMRLLAAGLTSPTAAREVCEADSRNHPDIAHGSAA